MREIKFRAWNVITKTMIDLKKITPLALNMDTDGLFIPFSDGLPLMQFTGLKDKNGIEIYESDLYTYGTGRVREVVFADGCFMGDYANGASQVFIYTIDAEIIGNIYEHPELISSEA